MSAEIVNLRRARKANARSDRESEAVAARARHGRTKGERTLQALEAGRAARRLDGARRDAAPSSSDGG